MRRRDFITLLGGVAASWPLGARAEQPEPTRRIGVLMNRDADDLEGQAGTALFQQSLQQLGWSNVRIDTRWGGDNVDRERRYADELIALAPDIILAAGSVSVMALQHVTRSLPIVFVGVIDPVGTGFVDALARPGGNITGFMVFEYSFPVKWLELLKQIAPSMTRVAFLRDPANPANIAEFVAIRSAGQPLGVEVSPINVQVANEIERAVTAFAQSANGGLMLTGSGVVSVHLDLIIALAAKYKLPTICGRRSYVTRGGLISYGPDRVDQFRLAAGYVDRILKGEKPGDLPVQAPTKYQLIINLKTAKALGFTIPPSLLATADEVIE
jgi:putative tryptophan/tyrosine transport system substrate-binding protein